MVDVIGNAPIWPIKLQIYSLAHLFSGLHIHIPKEILLCNFFEFLKSTI